MRPRRLAARSIQASRILMYALFSDCIGIRGTPLLYQPCLMRGSGEIRFEDGVSIGFAQSPHFYSTYAYLEARSRSARILIGSGTHLNNNCSIIAEHGCIRIGRDVLLGTGVEIVDSDFHGISPGRRRMSRPEDARDVTVGDNCFLASNVRVLKGVTIGDNSVVGNSSVVVGDIPSGVVASGAPARVVRTI